MSMMAPVPTVARAMRYADFPTMTAALDYAAAGESALHFHNLHGALSRIVSYRELRSSSILLAHRLLAAGLEPGDRVALLADTTPEFVEAFFACLYAGLIAVPFPVPAPLGGKAAYIEQIRALLSASAARAIVIPEDYRAWLTERVAVEGVRPLSLNELPATGMHRSQDLPVITPEQTGYLQFSSGSTRTPTGVVVSHRALMANMAGISREGLQLRAEDRLVSWLPFYHDMGLVGFLLVPVATQMTIDLLPTAAFVRRPLLWLELISRNGGTVSYSPTFGYELCVRRTDTAMRVPDLSSWRIAGVGGDMVRAEPLNAFADRFEEAGFRRNAFVPSYGMAEATLALTFARVGCALSEDVVDMCAMERDAIAHVLPAESAGLRTCSFVRCGRILPGHELQVRNDKGGVLGDRQVGRIFVRGPSLMKEYFRQPEAMAAVLSHDGWLDTGDLGFLTDGELTPTGRTKDVILMNGRNIWPQDLEWSVETGVTGIRSGDVAAFSSSDDQQIVLLVQCRSREPEDRSRITQETAALIRARHGIDIQVALVGPHALPRTSSGKLSRSKARGLYESGAFDSEQGSTPHI